MLGFYERLGWDLEYKLNGTCTVIQTCPFEAWTRHKEEHKAWRPNPELLKDLLAVDGTFAAELLHSKGTGHSDVLVLFDVLKLKGQSTVGTKRKERIQLLHENFKIVGETKSHFVVSPTLWIFKQHHKGFRAIFDSLSETAEEGVVLKDPESKLGPMYRQSNNQPWQVKCRKTTKNFGF
jgi:hypothetical protein